MNVFAWVRILGHSFISKQIKSTLDHHLSASGRAALGANLAAVGTALAATPPNDQAAADALADVLLAIH